MEEGGAGFGVRAAAAWHRPRGQERITYLRRTVPTTHGLGPAVVGLHRCARARVWRRGRRGAAWCDVVRVRAFRFKPLQSLNTKLAHHLTLYYSYKSSRVF
jgi:hypothetical protein